MPGRPLVLGVWPKCLGGAGWFRWAIIECFETTCFAATSLLSSRSHGQRRLGHGPPAPNRWVSLHNDVKLVTIRQNLHLHEACGTRSLCLLGNEECLG